MKNSELKGNLLLLLTALIWGFAFVAQSVGMNYVGPFTFECARSFIGAAVLVPVFLFIDHKKKRSHTYTAPTAEEKKSLLVAGIICGLIMTVASNLQQIGMQYTTAGKAGFITAMYILIVPILGIFLKQKVAPKLWGCVVIAAVGLYLLSVTDGFSSINKGDFYIFLCAIVFAVHIMVIDHYVDKVDGVRLSCLQFFICSILSGVAMFMFESPTWEGIMGAASAILYAGIMSCGVGYTLQIIGQKYTNPTMASLILSLESVFAVLGGIIVLSQIPTPRETLGSILMFAAIIIPQLPERKTQIARKSALQ